MVDKPLAPFRFTWKHEPYIGAEKKIIAWVRCRKGRVWFEREINARDRRKYIHLGDPQVTRLLHARVPHFGVRGARGQGILVDQFEIPGRIVVFLYALRDDWQAFQERT